MFLREPYAETCSRESALELSIVPLGCVLELTVVPGGLKRKAIHTACRPFHKASACLANLAEMEENQQIISREGGVRPAIAVMRSRYVEVQREAGRLLANLRASACVMVLIHESRVV